MVHITPGITIEDVSVFPPSVAQLETAIPAFVGYTEFAMADEDIDLHLKPAKIQSMSEYVQYFGGPQEVYGSTGETGFYIHISKDSNGAITQLVVSEPELVYLLHYAMKVFFDNGGGQCYIVSVGGYDANDPKISLSDDGGFSGGLMDGLQRLKEEDEPTLIVIPEAVKLQSDSDYQALVQAILKQCNDLGDRFAVFDLRGGSAELVADNGNSGESIADNNSLSRNRFFFGTSSLKNGAVYYPFLRTGINYFVNQNETNILVKIDSSVEVTLGSLKSIDAPAYTAARAELNRHHAILPPSAAVVGQYAAIDRLRGVWKAPANVSLNNVIEPLIDVDNAMQEAMNIDAITGKSVNAIRHFAGKGTLVWGARTLAGNDNEWRYIPVRRLLINIEESIKKSMAWVIFEPNDANTWVKVRSMIENYLNGLWREGAFAGSSSSAAFYVRCGLGTTMVSQDILEGRINIEIGIAAVRPAEFVIVRLSLTVNIP